MSKANRRNVTLALDKDLVSEARELDLDLSAIADAALRTAVQAARRDILSRDQTETGVQSRAGLGTGGLRLAGWHALQANSRA